MYELALFAGAGGGLLATKHLLRWQTVCYVEIDPYCIQVIKARIGDGYLDDAPIWDDARTFDGVPWRGCVDIITAGFPCQPFSGAGKRAGGDDNRNMWPDTIRIIREVKPPLVLLENVPGLLAPFRDNGHPVKPAYFGSVLRDLAQSGYDARWRVLSAAEVGAPFVRDRIFVVAVSNGIDGNERMGALQDRQRPIQSRVDQSMLREVWLQTIERNAGSYNRLAYRMEQNRAIGNGQVPRVVTAVWELLT